MFSAIQLTSDLCNEFQLDHYGLGAINLLNGMSETVIDLTTAYFLAFILRATTSVVGTAIEEINNNCLSRF